MKKDNKVVVPENSYFDQNTGKSYSIEMTPLIKKFHKVDEVLSQFFVERDEEIHSILIAALTGENLLLLGAPGTAKSYLASSFNQLISGATFFFQLLTKFTTPEELFGPYKLSALKNDLYIRNIEHNLPTAHIILLDEIFKASPALLNSLLGVLNERTFRNGEELIKIPAVVTIASSNEIPEESDNLDALYDRFIIKLKTKAIQETGNFIKMLSMGEFSEKPVITLQDIYQAKKEVAAITVSEEAMQMYSSIRDRLKTENLAPTDRTFKKALRIVQAEAYLQGRDEISTIDFDILKHCFWSDPDKQKTVYKLILDLINPTMKKVQEYYEEILEIYGSFNNINKDKKDEKTKKAIELISKLQSYNEKISVCKNDIKRYGQDTRQVDIILRKLDDMKNDIFKNTMKIDPTVLGSTK